MYKTRIFAVALFLLFSMTACKNQATLQERYDDHDILNPLLWKDLSSRPLVDRFEAANTTVIDYVNLDNQIFGYPERPTPATLNPEFIEDLRQALASIPEAVVKLVSPSLQGIVFLENLGSSGYTAYVLDEQRNPVGAFIVLDLSAMQRTANEWSSWKENTPFIEDTNITIVSTIETDANNNRANALRYILLHEFAHVLSASLQLHPRFDKEWDCQQEPLEAFPYLQLSWLAQASNCDVSSKFDNKQMPNRSKVKYYSAGNLPATKAAEVYRELEQTNFPTLYASTNWYDDFADSFASYVHTQIDQRPYRIEIYEHGKLAEKFNSCWGSNHCAEKQRYFEQLLKAH